jgi:hypothetical protein
LYFCHGFDSRFDRQKSKKMKQQFTRIKTVIITLAALLGFAAVSNGQTTLYEENFGEPTSNTLIENFTGWQNTSVIYVGNGTCDIRKSSASTGYGGASGGGNVMINDTIKWFQISGLNTSATSPTVNLYCGLRKTSAENGSNFVVEFSTDSLVWVSLPMSDTLPTGTGTGKWYRVCFPNVPAHQHLHLRFSNKKNVDYRLDDIRIVEGNEVADSSEIENPDLNSLVVLPFDISDNSDSSHTDIKSINGFTSYKLGSSYANGSAKFESKNAGSATLTAHLDSSPGTLTFDLKGVKSGSPSSYAGIAFEVSESADGEQWSPIATLYDTDISTEGFSHHGPYDLSESTRHVRWRLVEAESGNTQLNNISITKYQNGSGTDNHTSPDTPPYPNPAVSQFRWNLCEDAILIQLYDITGSLIREWQNVPDGSILSTSGITPGNYILQAETSRGRITKKLIIK